MSMLKTKEALSKLNEVDLWSLILFALFKLRNIPEYSSLSELVYILDKPSLLKLCEYFGGMTLRIPTISELEDVVYALVLYQHVNIEHVPYQDALKLLGQESCDFRKIKSNYIKITEILDKYDFTQQRDEQ